MRYLWQSWHEFVPMRRGSYGYRAIGKFIDDNRAQLYGRRMGRMKWLDGELLKEVGGLGGLRCVTIVR